MSSAVDCFCWMDASMIWIRRQVLYCIAFGNGVEAVNLFSMKCTIV